MPPHQLSRTYEEEDDEDDGFGEDMEALRRACMLTGTNPDDHLKNDDPQPSFDSDEEDDLELLRRIRSRFSISSEALSLEPLSDSDEEEDDGYHTLLAVQKRFAAYENDTLIRKATGQRNEPAKAAELFMDAIRKNRSNQKFLQAKLSQIDAKIEENNKLKERVKILNDFEVSCKRQTGDALSLKKDPRVQLVSSNSKGSKKKSSSAMLYGPQENSHVANYNMTLKTTTFLNSLDRKRWSEEERKALEKGIRQQFQEMVLLQFSDGDSDHHIDDILASIKDVQITPQNIREFLPKVNWEQLASMYLHGRRSGGECEARWLNWEDPLINHEASWTAKEDKNLLYLVQNKGIDNWFDIAVSLGTNRTPFQCLARYQRSLNASILKREWTKDEDENLRSAVEAFGERDWQSVASVLGGRTGTQCSNRWKKSLHPTRERQGRWSPEEDKRLKVAQMLFGPKNWNKTAQFVPGRTQAQCRDRYVNVLEPSLNWGEWTEEEDSRLRAAIAEHGYCWSKVAAGVPRRTDNMCWRRWKALSPDEVSLLRQVKTIKKAALICNFVDRETERPAIGPNDFLPPPTVASTKKKVRPRSDRSNNSQSCGEVPAGMVNCEEVATCDVFDAFNNNKKVRKLQPRRHKGTEPTGDCQVIIVPVPHENDMQEEPLETSCSDQIVGTSDGDNTTLACFTPSKLKKKKSGPSDPSINRKKRKLLVPDSAFQDYPSSSLIACDNQRKLVGVNHENDQDADDILLVSLAKKKLRLRLPESAKSVTIRTESHPRTESP